MFLTQKHKQRNVTYTTQNTHTTHHSHSHVM